MAEARHLQRISAEQMRELEDKYRRIDGASGVREVEYNGMQLVFRKPTRIEAKGYNAKRLNDDPMARAEADEQVAQHLVVACCGHVGPEARERFLDLLEDYPMAPQAAPIGRALGELMGVMQSTEGKASGLRSTPNGGARTSTPKA